MPREEQKGSTGSHRLGGLLLCYPPLPHRLFVGLPLLREPVLDSLLALRLALGGLCALPLLLLQLPGPASQLARQHCGFLQCPAFPVCRRSLFKEMLGCESLIGPYWV